MTKRKALAALLFALYAAALLFLLFHRAPHAARSYNFHPLETIRGYLLILRDPNPWADALRRYAAVNFAGNVAAFVPLGLFLPLLFRNQRRLWLFLPTVLLLVSAVELTQYVTRLGSLDVDDLLLNVLGALLGYGLWRLLRRGDRRRNGPRPGV